MRLSLASYSSVMFYSSASHFVYMYLRNMDSAGSRVVLRGFLHIRCLFVPREIDVHGRECALIICSMFPFPIDSKGLCLCYASFIAESRLYAVCDHPD